MDGGEEARGQKKAEVGQHCSRDSRKIVSNPPPFRPPAKKGRGKLILPPPFSPPPPDTYYTPLPRNTHTPLLLAILGQGRVS